ncbi:sensor domain-containing phosphodiesterase [Rhizobium sp. C4]|uniref:sensor domain-containing phosphodiesterase n=1 Tax=Rhizobium sp. C4 TaxID=1349800 RepID=UPI001E55DCD4|nr:EAL domain-containing protein [Rhizobium sp. C4]MCD2174905.1 EAL domain-containing protein [Rhizobium sp. C4]
MSNLHDTGRGPTPLSAPVASNINLILDTIRTQMNMDVAFLAEFSDAVRIFQGVSSLVENPPIRAGDIHPIGAGYCRKVVEGALPQLIPNTADVPATAEIPETAEVPIGAHLSVPLKLEDGQIYGTLCCFAFTPRPDLGETQLVLLRQLADLMARMLAGDISAQKKRRRTRKLVEAAIAAGDPAIVFQPIVNLRTRAITGFEALSRFASEPPRSPDKWFADAELAGLGSRLELLAAERALTQGRTLPADCSININLSPKTILTGNLQPLLALVDPASLVIEITEHAAVDDYAELQTALKSARAQGVRIAIDDAGAGYASLHHILKLQPDIIKFDTSLTRDIDTDPLRIAMISALTEYARRTGTVVVAEGVETAEEETTLRDLGVDKGQGYLFSKPKPAAEFVEQSKAG